MLLTELIGAGTLTTELERRLLEAADGNPLFLEELVRSLVDAGALVQNQDGGWRLDHDVPIVIPRDSRAGDPGPRRPASRRLSRRAHRRLGGRTPVRPLASWPTW